MENKQTALSFFLTGLIDLEIGKGISTDKVIELHYLFDKAKEMEKEQIAKAFDDGDYNYHYSRKTGNDFENGEEYFKELYGGNK
jgi:hypothetical protein